MGTADVAAAHMDGRSGDMVRSQVMKQDTAPHNVHNGVHRAHLVKMHLLGRGTVNGSLRLGQPPEYGDAVGFYRLGKTASLDQIHNVYNIPAQTVAMVVVMSRSMVVVMGVLVVMVMVLNMVSDFFNQIRAMFLISG